MFSTEYMPLSLCVSLCVTISACVPVSVCNNYLSLYMCNHVSVCVWCLYESWALRRLWVCLCVCVYSRAEGRGDGTYLVSSTPSEALGSWQPRVSRVALLALWTREAQAVTHKVPGPYPPCPTSPPPCPSPDAPGSL